MSTYPTIAALIQDRRWTAGKSLSAFDSAANYSGPDKSEWVVGLSKTSDSDTIANANFEALLHMLGGEQEGLVEAHRFGHWACGWVEQIMVNATAVVQLETLRSALNTVADYPILCDETHAAYEQEYKSDCFDIYRSDCLRNVGNWLGLDQDQAEALGSEESWDAVLWAFYDEECGYCGTEDAYIDVKDVDRLIVACASYFPFVTPRKTPNRVAHRLITEARKRGLLKARA